MKRNTIDHPKMRRLARRVGGRAQAVGIMECLWQYAGRFARRGDIGRWNNEAIADAVYWDGDSDELIRHLVECGWLDQDAEHRLLIHDWAEHCEDSVKKTLANNQERFIKPGKNTKQNGNVGNVQDNAEHFLESSGNDAKSHTQPEPLPLPEPGEQEQVGEAVGGADGSLASAYSPDGEEFPDIRMPLKDGGEYHAPTAKIQEWRETYPDLDVDRELRVACQFARDNPDRRKTRRGATKFFGSWLNRARAGPPSNGRKPQREVENISVGMEYDDDDPFKPE